MEARGHIDPATGLPRIARTFWSVQCLRGLAALMVVVGHAQGTVAARMGGSFERSMLLPWGAGVDLFFVISGFVMVHASRRLFAAPDARARFLLRRLARIVPLYWLVTVATLALLGAAAVKGGDPFPALLPIVASFAFVPFDTWHDGHLFPVVDLGWTLNYELFFYVVFAVFVALPRRRALAGVAATMAALAIVGVIVPVGGIAWFWSRPIIVDFVLGLAVGTGVAEGWGLPRVVRVAIGVVAALAFVVDPTGLFAGPAGVTVANEWPRVLLAGLPCAALLAAATWGAEPRAPGVVRPIAAVGDASYSLYLLHPFALIVADKLLQKSAAVRALPAEALLVAIVGTAIALALVGFRTIERPITRRLTLLIERSPRLHPRLESRSA